MTDQSAIAGISTQPISPQPLPVAQPTVPATPTSPSTLGFTTPVGMSSTSAPIPQQSVATNRPINQVLQERAPQAPVVPAPSMVPPATPAPVDKTKIDVIAMTTPVVATPAPTTTTTPIATPTIDLTNPLAPPVTIPFVPQPMANSLPTTLPTAPAMYNKTPAGKAIEAPDLAALSTRTPTPYLQIETPNTPTTAHPTAQPQSIASNIADRPVDSVKEAPLNPQTQEIFKFIHFFTTCVLGFLGILGIYAAIRFILVDYPKFESSFNENALGEDTIIKFVTKAGLMLFGTAISLFFTIHTNMFIRKKTSAPLVIASIIAVIFVAGLMFSAMRMSL